MSVTVDVSAMKRIGHVGVDSGQIMIVDPCYLDKWDSNEGQAWDLELNSGEFSYQGVSGITIEKTFGEVGLGSAVVSSSGYGDGFYPVYAEVDEDGTVMYMIIDFLGIFSDNEESE